MAISESLRADIQRTLGLVVSDVCSLLQVGIEDEGRTLVAYIVPRRDASKSQIKRALERARILVESQIAPRIGQHSWMVLVTDEPGKQPVLYGEYSEILGGDLRKQHLESGSQSSNVASSI